MWRHIRNLVGGSQFKLVPLEGVLTGQQDPVRAVYCGSGINQSFLADLVFDRWQPAPVQELSGGHAVRKACRAIANVDVVLTDLPPFWAWVAPPPANLSFPAWVRQEIVLPAAGVKVRRLVPRAAEREAARYRRRHAYRVDFTTDATAMRAFFHDYYQPYIRARFGVGAIAVSEEHFLDLASHQVLARLYRGAEWVMGMLLAQRRHTLRFGWFGANENPPPPGASDVLDLACIERAHAEGAQRVALGHSRPVLSDGVVRYKSKFGAQLLPTRFPQAVLGIELRRPQAALVERLNARGIVGLRSREPVVHRVEMRSGQLHVEFTPVRAHALD